MKILVIGANGLLGTDLVDILSQKYEITGIDMPAIDITDAAGTERVITDNSPTLVINAAAYTDVDGAERNQTLCHSVNATGTLHVAAACKRRGIKLIHLSTDFIFDGKKGTPYTEDAPPRPLNTYGASKLAGENLIRETLSDCTIIRTAWLFGKHGKNFVNTIMELAASKKELKIVDDQRGSPTYTRDLAAAIGIVIKKGVTGTIHITNSGNCSWYEFGKEIVSVLGIDDVRVIPITSKELKRLAQRPANSTLNTGKFEELTGTRMRSWQEALREYLQKGRN